MPDIPDQTSGEDRYHGQDDQSLSPRLIGTPRKSRKIHHPDNQEIKEQIWPPSSISTWIPKLHFKLSIQLDSFIRFRPLHSRIYLQLISQTSELGSNEPELQSKRKNLKRDGILSSYRPLSSWSSARWNARFDLRPDEGRKLDQFPFGGTCG